MRDKVLQAIEVYLTGGTVERALDAVGISKTPFRKWLAKDPEIMRLYESAMRARGYNYQDEAYTLASELGTENGLDPKTAHVKAQILIKLSSTANPDRFGDRMQVQHEVKPNLIGAIEEGKRRSLLPTRDPAQIIDAEYTEIPSDLPTDTSDKQSAAFSIVKDPGAIDPFEA